MPIRTREQFVWIPQERPSWTCTIAGTDVKDYILSGKFPNGLISEELICEIELDNSGENWTNLFKARDIIQFTLTLLTGNTINFEGEVEEISKKFEGGVFNLAIKGAHYTAQLLDIMVTKEFSQAKISDIRKSLIDTYLTGFTYTNIEENTSLIDIKFVNKPFLDCFLALDIEGDEDTYIDFNKDFHTFKRESKNNNDIAIVMNDLLIELKGLGQDSAEVRNKITVYGDAGGLPVIHTSEDSASQTSYRIKERVMTDTSITDEDTASAIGDAENFQLKNPVEEGSAECFLMAKLVPGYMTYVIFPPQDVHSRYRVVKYVNSVPNETTEVFFNQERSISKLFKDRIKKDMNQETITNPFAMKYSYNFTFDDENKIDSSASSDYILSEGKIRKDSAVESAIIISNAKTTPVSVSSVHIVAIGEVLDGATYWIQANTLVSYQQITLDTLTNITNTGTELRLKMIITSANTRLDSIAVLYK